MERMSLAGKWILHMDKQDRDYEADVPCSDYGTLLKNGAIDDPFTKRTNTNAFLSPKRAKALSAALKFRKSSSNTEKRFCAAKCLTHWRKFI